jgi:NAD(P)-dependent dehydrogenase (short-subunit alcohol dehydrogenase family)
MDAPRGRSSADSYGDRSPAQPGGRSVPTCRTKYAPPRSRYAGVIALTKSLGKELAGYRIAVNCVTPAPAKTRLFEQMTQEHIDYMLAKIPRGRFLLVEEVAAIHDGRRLRPERRSRDVLSAVRRSAPLDLAVPQSACSHAMPKGVLRIAVDA